MNNLLPQFTTFSVEKRIGKETNWDPQTKPSDFVAELLGVEEPVIVPPGYVPKVRLPLPPPNERLIDPLFAAKSGPSPLDLEHRGQSEDGQLSAPAGVLTVRKPKAPNTTKDLLQFLKIENGSSRPIDVFIQTPFSIRNLPLRGHSVLVKDLAANAKLKTIAPTPEALAAQAMLSNSLAQYANASPPDSACFCLYAVPTKQLVLTMTGKQELQNFTFANGPIGMQVEVVEEFDRKILMCTRVVPGSQAHEHAAKLTYAEIVAVNGNRVLTLSEFQCTVAVAKETVGCIVITALTFRSDKAREESLTAHKLKRNKSVKHLFQGIMGGGMGMGMGMGGGGGGLGSPDAKKKHSQAKAASVAARAPSSKAIQEGDDEGNGGGDGEDSGDDDSDSDDDEDDEEAIARAAAAAAAEEEDEDAEDDILTRRHRKQRAIAAKLAEHTVERKPAASIAAGGPGASKFADSAAAAAARQDEAAAAVKEVGEATPPVKNGRRSKAASPIFGRDDSDSEDSGDEQEQDAGDVTSVDRLGYTVTVQGLQQGAEQEHRRFEDVGSIAEDNEEDDEEVEGGAMLAKVKKSAPRPATLPLPVSVEPSEVVETTVEEPAAAGTFLTGTGAEVAAEPSVASSKPSVFTDITPFKALICPPKLIVDSVSRWGQPTQYCQFQNFSTFWKVCVYWVDEDNTLVLRKTLYPLDDPHVDMISASHAWVITVSKLKETKLAAIRARLKDRVSGGKAEGRAVAASAADELDDGEDEEESVGEGEEAELLGESTSTVDGEVAEAVSNVVGALGGAVAAGGTKTGAGAAKGVCNRYCLAYRPSESILQSSKSTNIVWLPSESLTVAQRMRPTSSLYKVPAHQNRFHPLVLRQSQSKTRRNIMRQQQARAGTGVTTNGIGMGMTAKEQRAQAEHEANYAHPNVNIQVFDTKQLKTSTSAVPTTPPSGSGKRRSSTSATNANTQQEQE